MGQDPTGSAESLARMARKVGYPQADQASLSPWESAGVRPAPLPALR